MNVSKYTKSIAVLALGLVLSSCRGEPFKEQPVHPNMNMDQQSRKEAQETNAFFEDNRSMRQPVEGTVSRGNLKADTEFYYGKTDDGSFVESNPMEVTKAFLYKGQKNYEIYCTPCHGGTGDGKGIIMTGNYGFVPAPTYHQDRLRDVTDGYMYDVIANGIRNMSGYGTQIDVEERWAIVAYVRALQKSQNVSRDELEQYDVDIAALEQAYQQEQEELAQQKAAQEKAGGEVSAERGKELFAQQGCQACHSVDGTPGVGPSQKGLFGKERTLDDGTTVTANEEYLKNSIVNPHDQVVDGYNAVMPANYGDSMTNSEIESLVAYIKSLE
jgi:mono/diheme cytochrome c family protein